jgi:hypothetical protein
MKRYIIFPIIFAGCTVLLSAQPDRETITPAVRQVSELPLIIINTLGQEIPDEPKITAKMGVINNPGGLNKTNDPFNDYDGMIGIELRGSSSLMFEKNNYTFETRLADGSNNNVSLLGLPSENDWVLHGPYSDKTLMRNALAYHLGNQMGRWAPHTQFCELYMNSDYRGVYLLVEKIKQDKNRVDIAKLNPDEISGIDLTGGYILSIDRKESHYWISPYIGINDYGSIIINYVDPKYEEMATVQREYIKNYVTAFEDALKNESLQDTINGYRAFADPASFIDFFLISEMSRNVDAYRLSTYFYKDKGGKLTMGPIWDFNLAFGNADYYNAFATKGWMMNSVEKVDLFQVPFWWERLRQDDYFNDGLRKRWMELRRGPFQTIRIYNYIDSISKLLVNPQTRNFSRFPVLGKWIWPNFYVGETYSQEISFMKDWIEQRLLWMDQQFNLTGTIGDNQLANIYETYAFPNPFSEQVTIRLRLYNTADVKVSVFDMTGRLIYSEDKHCKPGVNDFIISEEWFRSQQGFYIYEIRLNGEKFMTGKIVKCL